MSDVPFFSVVIPVLNEAEYLPRLLSDLKKQTDRAFEVIIVDGGSVDATLEKARAFSDALTLTIISSERKNVCYQRNRGAREAKGLYLVFFDADVQIPYNYLSRIRQFLQKEKVPFVTTRIKSDSHQVYDQAIVKLVNLTMDVAQVMERPFVGGYNFMVLKSVFELVGGFREDVVHAEDADLSLRLHQAGYRLTVLKSPTLTFSLRRFRAEGRIKVLQKNAAATLHIFTKGPITKEIFSYPMGGLWYKLKRREEIRPQVLKQAEIRVRRFLKLFLE